MITKITHLTLFVTNQEDALNFYKKIGFTLHTDAAFDNMRWLTICLPNQKDFEVAILKAETDQEKALVGKQNASKPLFSVESNDCKKDYESFTKLGINFTEKPAAQPWGISAEFQDLYGNIIYMCEPK